MASLRDWRPDLLRAKREIVHLQTKLNKMKHITKIEEKHIVKKYLSKAGHKATSIKHIMNPKLTSHKNYNKDDISTGVALKNIRKLFIHQKKVLKYLIWKRGRGV